MLGAAGVSSPRHAFIGILQELGKTSQSPLANAEVVHGRGQPETAGDGLRGILRPHSTDEGGEPQGHGSCGGHGTRWREGVNKRTHRMKETRRSAEVATRVNAAHPTSRTRPWKPGPGAGSSFEEPSASTCKLGSVRGAVSIGYGEPNRARCRKRRIQPRGYLRTNSSLPYSERGQPVYRPPILSMSHKCRLD